MNEDRFDFDQLVSRLYRDTRAFDDSMAQAKECATAMLVGLSEDVSAREKGVFKALPGTDDSSAIYIVRDEDFEVWSLCVKTGISLARGNKVGAVVGLVRALFAFRNNRVRVAGGVASCVQLLKEKSPTPLAELRSRLLAAGKSEEEIDVSIRLLSDLRLGGKPIVDLRQDVVGLVGV